MAEWDFSSYPHQTAPQQTNPFEMLGQAVNAVQGMNQIKQWNQEFTARKALGDIALHSIDPSTGEMDWNKYGIEISKDPRTAFKAPEIITQLNQSRLINLQAMGVQLEQNMTKFKLWGSTALAEAANGVDKVDRGRVVDKINQMVSTGFMNPDMAQKLIEGLPKTKPELYRTLVEFGTQSMSASEAMGQVNGKIFTQDFGGGIGIYQEHPGANNVTRLAVQPKSATPEQMQKTETTYGADGTGNIHYLPDIAGPIPVAPTPDMTGSGVSQAPDQPGTSQGQDGSPDLSMPTPGPATPEGNTGTGAGTGGSTVPGVAGVQTAQAPAPGAAKAPPPATPPLPPISTITKLSPAQDIVNKAFGEDWASTASAITTNNVMLQSLQEAELAMRQGVPGGGTSMRMFLGKLAQATNLFSQKQLDAINGGSMSAYQVMDKILTTNVFDVMKSLTAGTSIRWTQSELFMIAKVLPNVDTDPAAAHELIDFFRTQAGILEERGAMMGDYIKAQKAPQDFYQDWQDTLKAGGRIDYTPSGEGLHLEWGKRIPWGQKHPSYGGSSGGQ